MLITTVKSTEFLNISCMYSAECKGGPLVFVLKLDEAEILEGKKFERII